MAEVVKKLVLLPLEGTDTVVTVIARVDPVLLSVDPILVSVDPVLVSVDPFLVSVDPVLVSVDAAMVLEVVELKPVTDGPSVVGVVVVIVVVVVGSVSGKVYPLGGAMPNNKIYCRIFRLYGVIQNCFDKILQYRILKYS